MVEKLLEELNRKFTEKGNFIEQQKKLIDSLKKEKRQANQEVEVKEAELNELRSKLRKFKDAMKGVE